MTIREMKVTDYEVTDRLMQQLHKDHVEGRPDLYVPMEHIFTKEEFQEIVSDDKKIAILAEEDKEVMGICITSIRDRSGMVNMKTAYVDELVVDEKYRRQGIAKKLFTETEKRAKELGAVRLDLMVWSFNKNALKLYEAMGMKPQRYILEKEL